MIDKEGRIEIGDLEDGVEYVKTDDSSTSGDDSVVQQTIQDTQSELYELLSDGEVIDTDNVEYSSDEYSESTESRQAAGLALQEEFLNSEDTINTDESEIEADDLDDDEDE